MKLYLDFFIQSLSDKDSAQGFSGLILMFSSAFIADFSFIVGALTAIGGCILVVVNVMIKLKEYQRLRDKIDREEDEYNSINEKSNTDETLTNT